MMLKVRLSLFLFLFIQLESWATINIDIRQFGAINDGTTLNTIKIQAAIDSCYHLGGGTVVFPKGNYLTGTIVIRANVIKHYNAQCRRADFYASGKYG